MTDSGTTEHLPRLRGTSEHAARKIADRIQEFETLLGDVTTGNIRDLEDEAESKRRYTIELLRSLFEAAQPATEFDRETKRSVFYTKPSDAERRTNVVEDLRQYINQLRSLTARLDFYEVPIENSALLNDATPVTHAAAPRKAIQSSIHPSAPPSSPAGNEHGQHDAPNPEIPRYVWIPALSFTGIIILFFIAAFFLTPNLTNDQRHTLQALFAILAGFASTFLTGTALFQFTHTAPGTKLVFSGTAGVAVFALCMNVPPYFFRTPLAAQGVQQGAGVDTTTTESSAARTDTTRTETDSSNTTPQTATAAWSPRHAFAAVRFQEHLWVFGGDEDATDDTASYANDVWKSDDGATWSLVTKSAAWEGRASHAAVVFKNRMWIIGGTQGLLENGLSDVWASADGERWDPVVRDAPWGPRWEQSVVEHNGYLWLFGGASMQNGTDSRVKLYSRRSSFVDGRQFWLGGHSDVWRSIDGKQWEHLPDAPWSPRFGQAAASFSNGIWVFGGYDGEQFLNDVWFTRDGFTWTKVLANAPWWPRAGHTVTVAGGRMYVLGGFNEDYGVKTVLSDAPWSTVNGTSWRHERAVLLSAAQHAALASDHTILVLGGLPTNNIVQRWSLPAQ